MNRHWAGHDKWVAPGAFELGLQASHGTYSTAPRHVALPPRILAPDSGIAYNTTVKKRRVVLDTNVIVAGLRSRRGASFRLLSLLGEGQFEIALSVPLFFEYEDVLARHLPTGLLGQQDIEDFLDYICQVADHQRIFFLWRPCLSDPKDDMVLELAVAAGCEAIVTHNQRDFGGAERFGVRIDAPRDFLHLLEERS